MPRANDRIVIEIAPTLKAQFKAKVYGRNERIKTVLAALILDYVQQR